MNRIKLSARSELILLTLFMCGCASAPAPEPKSSLPGTPTLSPQLERDTDALVLRTEEGTDCTCNQRKITSREIRATDSNRVAGFWTVDRCDTILQYAITYLPSPGGTTIVVVPPQGITRKAPEKAPPQLPKMFESVWYRAGDRGFSLRAYSATGRLDVSENGIAFGESGEAFEIGVSEIKSICWGKLAGDTVNEWVVVRYGSPEKSAGFKDGSRLGWGTDTPSIMSTLLSVLPKKTAQPTR